MQTNPKQVPLYEALSIAIQARTNSQASGNTEWFAKWTARIKELADLLPLPMMCGAHLDVEASHAEKIVIQTSHHHMDENGFWDGWTEHTIVATPSFWNHVNLRISGHDRNDIKEDLHETFHSALTELVNEY